MYVVGGSRSSNGRRAGPTIYELNAQPEGGSARDLPRLIAAGLAIAESGCFLLGQTRQAAEQRGAAFAASLGCTDPATAAGCLRAQPAAALLAKAGGTFGGWGPVAGTPTLPLPPAAAFAAGRYAHVPLVQGTNSDEGRFFVGFLYDALGHPLTAAQYPQVLAAQFGAGPAALVQAVYPLSAYPSPDLAYAAVFTDSEFSCPALDADLLAARSGVYGYEFADGNAPNDFGVTFSFPLGAAHSTELQYVFGKIPYLDSTPSFTAAQFALSAQIMGYWARFAATGSPDGGGTPYWPRFTPDRQQIQRLIPSGPGPESGFAAEHRCSFWTKIEASA
jgi:para-nitrobenzyl esterase